MTSGWAKRRVFSMESFDHKEGYKSAYRLFLVTNRHVIEEHIAATSGPLVIRLNPKSGSSVREYDFPLVVNGLSTWHAHPDPLVDVAVVTLNGPWLEQSGIKFDYFHSDTDFLSRSKAKELGQPCSFKTRNAVLAVSRREASNKPSLSSGDIRAYLPYTDMAVSPQTLASLDTRTGSFLHIFSSVCWFTARRMNSRLGTFTMRANCSLSATAFPFRLYWMALNSSKLKSSPSSQCRSDSFPM